MSTKREIMRLVGANGALNSGMLKKMMQRTYMRKKPIKYSTMTLALESVRATSMAPSPIQSTKRMKKRWVRACSETPSRTKALSRGRTLLVQHLKMKKKTSASNSQRSIIARL